MTPQSFEIFVESVNQPMTTSAEKKMAKAAAYARGMGEGSIITIPVDIELFQLK